MRRLIFPCDGPHDSPARAARCRASRERGQSLAEMALLLPLFLLLIVGVIEVTGALNTRITVVNAARDGARLGSKGVATDQQIRDLVAAETNRLHPAIDASSDVVVEHTTVNGTTAIRVQVCADHDPIVTLRTVLPDSYRICSATTIRVADGGA
jgi:Flp pilus assembly protein TadG